MMVPPSYKKLKRGPQVILPKDIGIIIAYTGISKKSLCIDAGTGSGWLAVSLGRVAGRVVSYDTRGDFLKIAQKNAEIEGLDNIEFKEGDVTKKIDEKDADLVTLDLADSDKALKNARKALKDDGQVVGYLPHMEQVKKFVETLNKLKFYNVYTMEIIARDMLVREEGTRPSTKGVWHTGYIVFAQKKA